MITTLKVHEDTRKKLKLLAALLDKSMMDTLTELVDNALKQVREAGAHEKAGG